MKPWQKEILKQLPATITAVATGIALVISAVKNEEKAEKLDDQKTLIHTLANQIHWLVTRDIEDYKIDDQP